MLELHKDWIQTLPKANRDINPKFDTCPICHKLFANPSVIKEHINEIHNLYPVMCNICGNKYK